MTTLAVDDELYRLAREAAAAQGRTVDEFVGSVLREALSPPRLQQTVRNGLPVMVLSTSVPRIDPAKIRRQLEEDGF
jgi:hypothetical protein